MKRRFLPTLALWLLGLVPFAGCQPRQPVYFRESGDLSYYLDRATSVEYPDVALASLDEVSQNAPPVTVRNPDFGDPWELSLEDAVSIALQNSKVIRGYGTPGLQGTIVAAGVDSLANNPQGAGTTYSVAVRESEPGFIAIPGQVQPGSSITTNTGLESQQGVEAALAEFDTHFTASMFLDKTDRPRNTIPANPFSPTVFVQDSVNFQAQLAKKAATGTQFFFRNVTDYTRNNIPAAFQPLGSWYATALEAEVRQPLLRGRGVAINRMPVIMARIGTDQEIANLEAQLQNMVCNVEIRYWNLYSAYRAYEAAKIGEESAQVAYKNIEAKNQAGTLGVVDLSQAREQYFFFRTQRIQALSDLLDAENNLRWLMGLANSDSRMLRPSEEPVSALVQFDWWNSSDEALTLRPELRSQRWELKKKELQLAYARNGLLPRLDATLLYRWVGLGDELAAADRNGIDFPNANSRAWEGLTDGAYQEARLGLELGMPIGFRRELANVRNAQIKLARERARIEDMELDVQREMAMVFRALETNYELAKDHLNRWISSEAEVSARTEQLEVGTESLDLLFDVQRRSAQARVAYYQALSEYNKCIALLHRRKGTTLEYCGVQFGEGPWPEKAYSDAMDRARGRSAAREMHYGYREPSVVTQGNVGMDSMGPAGGDVYYEGEMIEGEYYDYESIDPAGQPTPAAPLQPTPSTDVPMPEAMTSPQAPRTDYGVRRTSAESEIEFEPSAYPVNTLRPNTR